MNNPSPHRVLLIEDGLDASQEIATLLKYLGSHVEVVPCAYSARQVVSAFQPDTVICSTALRGRNGFQVARELRQGLAAGPARFIGIMDLAPGALQDNEVEASGFDLHLFKPVTIMKLRAALDSLNLKDPPCEEARKPDFWRISPLDDYASGTASG